MHLLEWCLQRGLCPTQRCQLALHNGQQPVAWNTASHNKSQNGHSYCNSCACVKQLCNRELHFNFLWLMESFKILYAQSSRGTTVHSNTVNINHTYISIHASFICPVIPHGNGKFKLINAIACPNQFRYGNGRCFISANVTLYILSGHQSSQLQASHSKQLLRPSVPAGWHY